MLSVGLHIDVDINIAENEEIQLMNVHHRLLLLAWFFLQLDLLLLLSYTLYLVVLPGFN